jgi:MYXO-CTERM domain-containing protein
MSLHPRTLVPLLTCLTTATAAAAVALAPTEARACGGTFCDSGPQPMPVDQTGENIIFKIGSNFVEAHIQIQYDPNAEAAQFAWVIPVQTLPTFAVGSDLLFTNTLAATVPTYGLNDIFDSCSDPSTTGDSGGTDGTASTGGFVGGDGDGDGDGPSVVFEDTVGAFDVVVLQGGTVTEVMAWLAAEGYQQDAAAEPILDEYLQEGFMFAAVKLNNKAGISEIHPIALRYQGTEPCVPIRLTRIAAAEDMDIRVFFYGAARTVPTNYKHVEVNPLKIDWVNFAANYKDVITLAVDASGADGNAFVTEFAGTNPVSTDGLYSTAWDAAPFAAMADPNGVVDALTNQGLMDCTMGWGDGDGDGDVCGFFHPLLEGLLANYVPVPAGLTQQEFYDCVSCFPGQVDLMAWDAAAFSQAMTERIIDPGIAARDMVQDNAYVTRMYTTISDYEMNADPVFTENIDLPEVPNLRTATRQNHCDGTAHMQLPDGREVFMPAPGTWPDISPGAMPWEEDIDQGTISGPLVNEVDQTPVINALLDEWNRQAEPMGNETSGESGGDGESGGGSAEDGMAADAGGAGGCACAATGGAESPDSAAGLLALFGVGALARRRRSRR